jgi:hypothetical protein
VRIVFLGVSAALHWAASDAFYFEWVWRRPGIDGGPLGFLTWSIPLLVGSLAYDVVAQSAGRPVAGRLMLWGAMLTAVGYGLSCLAPCNVDFSPTRACQWSLAAPPFVARDAAAAPTYWMMSQRAGTPSYLIFGAGFSLLVFALFTIVSDTLRLTAPLFRTFGSNALAAYLIHEVVSNAVGPVVPKDSPLWFAAVGFAVYFGASWLFVRHLERAGLYLKL